jgi:hypothetical protein
MEIQSFEDLCSNHYRYVDNTLHLYRIATTGKIYVLPHPHHFWKSLTISTREAVFSSYDLERPETVPQLFQAGYLTIKEITKDNSQKLIYRFEPPNNEVRDAFTDHLFKAYTELYMNEMSRLHNDMRWQIKTCDSERLERSLRMMITQAPYRLHIEEEKYYHSLLLVGLYFLGFMKQGEISTRIGRIDAVWERRMDIRRNNHFIYSNIENRIKIIK